MSLIFLTSYAVLWLCVVLLMVTTFALARQIGVLHVRIPSGGARLISAGPDIGTVLPQLRIGDIEGKEIAIGGEKRQRSLVLFISPNCPSCEQLAPSLKSLAKYEKAFEMILISSADDKSTNRDFAVRYGLTNVKYVISQEASKFYRVGGTPFGMALDATGIVRGKGIVNNLEHVESLLNAVELGYSSMEEFMQNTVEPSDAAALTTNA